MKSDDSKVQTKIMVCTDCGSTLTLYDKQRISVICPLCYGILEKLELEYNDKLVREGFVNPDRELKVSKLVQREESTLISEGLELRIQRAHSQEHSELPFGRSGQGFLVPYETSEFGLKLRLRGMDGYQDGIRIDSSAEFKFNEIKSELVRIGFFVVSATKELKSIFFTGDVRGVAEVRGTRVKVGVILNLTGSVNDKQSVALTTVYCRDQKLAIKVIEIVEQSLWQ